MSNEFDSEIDKIADDFSGEWKQGEPSIPLYLRRVSTDKRPDLFRELLSLDLEIRERKGQPRAVGEYLADFPEYTDIIHSVFDAAGEPPMSPKPATDSTESADLIRYEDLEIDEPYIEGGMSLVHRARWKSTDVAVKVLKDSASDAEWRRLDREARCLTNLQALDNPSIIRFLGKGRWSDGRLFLVLEWVEGVNLDGWIEETDCHNEQSVRKAVEFMIAVAGAIERAHGQGIIHRDLKPSNVLLRHRAEVVVTDFGLAKPMNGNWSWETEPGQLLGTPYYMAPEQFLESQHVTKSVDVHGIGGVLYAFLTGQAPYAGKRWELEDRMRSRNFPKPPDCGLPSLQGICMKCLSKRPEDRYHSAREVAEALAQWHDQNSDKQVAAAKEFIANRLTRMRETLVSYLNQMAEAVGGSDALEDLGTTEATLGTAVRRYVEWGTGIHRKPVGFFTDIESIDFSDELPLPDLLLRAWPKLANIDVLRKKVEEIVNKARGYQNCGDAKQYRQRHLRDHIALTFEARTLVDSILRDAP